MRYFKSGFTLVELLLVTSFAAFIVAILIPGVAAFIQQNQLATAQNDLLAALHLARSEAIERAASVTACKSATGTACNGADWEDGWIVFTDKNADGAVDGGDGDTLLHRWAGLSDALTLRGNANVSSRVTFDALGSTGNNGTLTVCDTRDESGDSHARERHAKAVVISSVGRIRTAFDGTDDGIVDVSGANVSCP
jgi:type IV fimbrial biogenesis protein FimT